MALSEATIEKIRSPFPEASVQIKKSFRDEETGEQRYLTGYKPQYIIERLNDVFGHEGWDFEVIDFGKDKLDETHKTVYVWVLGKLSVYLGQPFKPDKDGNVANLEGTLLKRHFITSKQQFGTSKWTKAMELGDAYKSAATNALEKCASLLDIGHEAYKGLVPPPNTKEGQDTKDEIEKDTKQKALGKLCKEHGIGKAAFKTLIKTVLKEEKEINKLSAEELDKLHTHVEKHGSPF